MKCTEIDIAEGLKQAFSGDFASNEGKPSREREIVEIYRGFFEGGLVFRMVRMAFSNRSDMATSFWIA